MKFTLSSETRKLIEYSTGMSPTEQKNVSITEYAQYASEHQRRLYSCKESRMITPRGSAYLHLKRTLSLQAIKRFLKEI